MSFFDSITGPKWQNKNPQVRLAALDELDDQDTLIELVRSDPDASVQTAALARIQSPEQLDKFAESLSGDLQKQARSQRLHQLLPDKDKLDQISSSETLKRIIELSDDAKLIATVVNHIDDDSFRMNMASQHHMAKVRLAAATEIESLSLLEELMDLARGHDKSVYRHCKTVLDDQHNKAIEAEQQAEKIDLLTQQMAKLVTTAYTTEYESTYRALVWKWQEVKDLASPEQQSQFQRNQLACAEGLVKMADEIAANQEQQAALAETRQQFAVLIDELNQIDTASELPANPEQMAQLSEVLDDIERRWTEAAGKVRATDTQSKHYHNVIQLWRHMISTSQTLIEKESTLQSIEQQAENVDGSDYIAIKNQIKIAEKFGTSFSWPDSHLTLIPEQFKRLNTAIQQLQSLRSALKKDQNNQAALLRNEIEKLRQELDQDHSKEARQSLNKTRRLLKLLPGKKRLKFEAELKPLAARLHEVSDWQKFAVEPKKEALCASMTALIGSQEDPEVLSQKIKALQGEWKQLGAIPHSREQTLWNQFKAAADEAWEPCKIAFELQAEKQRQNYEERIRLVSQLTEYEEKMNWPDKILADGGSADFDSANAPDWRLVQKTLDTARDAFRNIRPLSPSQDRKSHKAFRTVCDRIYDHIREEYGRNISHKEKLVESAKKLSEMEDLRQAVESCKKLQTNWKSVGITPVGADRKLWKSFRAACDAVFARIDDQRAQNRSEMDERIKQAEALRDEAKALLTSKEGEQGLQLVKLLSELKQTFFQLELPSKQRQALNGEFLDMEKQAKAIIAEIKGREKQLACVRLTNRLTACALKVEDEKKANNIWQEEGELPKGIDKNGLLAFWEQGPQEGEQDAVRDICIGIEILGEIESPQEDKEARMSYQMKRLVTGMNSKTTEPELTLMGNVNGFIALRPTQGWVKRFCETLTQIQNSSGKAST